MHFTAILLAANVVVLATANPIVAAQITPVPSLRLVARQDPVLNELNSKVSHKNAELESKASVASAKSGSERLHPSSSQYLEHASLTIKLQHGAGLRTSISYKPPPQQKETMKGEPSLMATTPTVVEQPEQTGFIDPGLQESDSRHEKPCGPAGDDCPESGLD